ncbi:unnamed protein product [Paramecium primaurelia]|uniref:Protein kinase domain-containing protein n=1 Tax=Paramecium primaurelia TaxID=5886 RepID=A0A8S1QIL7_PARPR|nr:unnamed protein product [Paramecium primaurelia]
MGNSQNGKEDMDYDQVMKNFSFYQEINHFQLGNIKIFDAIENKNHKVFQFKRLCQSDQQLQQLKNHFQQRKTLMNEHLIRIFYVMGKESVMCSDASHVVILGEYFLNTLQTEHEYNLNQKLIFNESRLWLIIYQIIQCCAYLEEQGKYHGDLNIQHIYLDLDGSVKLIEHDLIPGAMNPFQKSLYNNEFHAFSPELLNLLQQGDKENSYMKLDIGTLNKTDVFSLGLIILELASQFPTQQYYDWQTKTLNYQQIISAIQFLPNRGYSTILQNLLLQMCQQDIEARPGFQEMRTGLKSLENDILSHTAFYRSHIK